MSYTIRKANGETLLILNDGLIDTNSSSLTFIGKNVTNFGDAQNENFLHLLEHYASNDQPRNPLKGQIWFNAKAQVFRPAVYDGTNWRSLAVLHYSNTTTDKLINAGAVDYAASRPGDLWFNSASKQLYVVTGTNTTALLIGPERVEGFNETKMRSAKMVDSSNISHPVIQVVLDNEVIAIISKDFFVCSTAGSANTPSGFTRVYRGVTFKNYDPAVRYSTTSTDVVLHGLHEQLDQTYLRKNVQEHITSSWYFDNNVTLNFGTTGQSGLQWDSTSSSLVVRSESAIKFISSSSSLLFNNNSIVPSNTATNLGGLSSAFNILYINKLVNSNTLTNSSIVGLWNLTSGTTFTPELDLSNSIGSSSTRFSSVFTRTVSAGSPTSLGNIIGSWQLAQTSTIEPVVDAGSDLGQPSKRFRKIYAAEISANNSSSAILVTGNLLPLGDIIPQLPSTNTLGSDPSRWAAVYADSIYGTATNSLSAQSLTVVTDNFTATTSTIVNTIPARDASANIYANLFVGTATRALNANLASQSLQLKVDNSYFTATVSVIPNTVAARDDAGDISARYFRGTAVSSQYADLAEKYLTDSIYDIGTVVTVGGTAEVTAATGGDKPIGVISENPAYLMNSESLGQAVALKGRVPVRVTGPVTKGQFLVAQEDGVATAVSNFTILSFAIALESNFDEGFKLVEAVII